MAFDPRGADMQESFYVETESGTVLSADRDGIVVHARPGSPGVQHLVASAIDGPSPIWLLEPIDAGIDLRLSGSSSEHGGMLAMMPVMRDGKLRLELPESGLALDAEPSTADGYGLVTAGGRPGVFRRGADHGTNVKKDGVCFDRQTLGSLLESGQPDDVPIAAAMLQVLSIEDVRAAWLRCTDPAVHDRLFAIAQARGASSLERFEGYTADKMKADIELYGWSVGERTYGHPRMVEVGRGKLTIGRYCSLADPTIVLGNHQPASASSYPFMDLWSEWPGSRVGLSDHVAGDVTIGNDVWIGIDAIVLPGAVIGDGAVIGAGAVVRGKIPPYAVCIGNPATIKRYRFEPGIIERLSRLRWWDWPDAVVSRYIPLLLDLDIERFLSAAEVEFGFRPAPPRLSEDVVVPETRSSWLRRVSGARWRSSVTQRPASAHGAP